MTKLEKVIFLTCAFLILLHTTASFFPKERLWGINLLYYVPSFPRWLLVIFGFLVLIPSVNRSVADGLAKFLALIANNFKRVNKYYKYALISLLSFLPFWIFKIKTYLLGDGNLRVVEILDGRKFSSTEPLDFYLHAQLSRFLKLDPFTTYAILSCLAGVVFVFLILLLSDLLGKEGQEKFLFFSVLATMGANQLFFGYVESYTLVYVAQAGFILFSLYYLKGRCGFFWPSLIFLLSLSLHLSAIFLLPSVLYLCIARKSQEAEPGNKILSLGNITKMVWILLIVGVAFLISRNYSPQQSDFSSFLISPLGSNADHYSLFYFSHLLDFLNHQLLVSPLGIPLWFVLISFFRKKIKFKKNEVTFLFVISLCALIFALTVDPKLGYPRDWDLFAFTGLGYTILVVFLLVEFLKESKLKRLRYLTLALAATALVSTFPWIYVNSTEIKGVERLADLLDLGGQRSALGHEQLAYYYRSHGQKDKEIEEWKKAIALFQKPRYIKNLAVAYVELGNYQEAASQLEKVLTISPNDHLTHSDLGKVYAALGRYKEVKQQLQKAIQLQPDNPLYCENLGFILVNLGENQEAIKYLELYLKYQPQAQDRDYVQGLIKQLMVKEKELRR
jgi:hypothetical protein